ncbi:hypothetical protein Ciccas_009956 [Cichlidogyrus casuarinus]|uniref:Uncharacterized protein n=1 Tax=Cichlidogyrus casuarinus TaxID=1844966 RepID=A0ABD2PVH9_9PLAT
MRANSKLLRAIAHIRLHHNFKQKAISKRFLKLGQLAVIFIALILVVRFIYFRVTYTGRPDIKAQEIVVDNKTIILQQADYQFVYQMQTQPTEQQVQTFVAYLKLNNKEIWNLLYQSPDHMNEVPFLNNTEHDFFEQRVLNRGYLLVSTRLPIPAELALVEGKPYEHFYAKTSSIPKIPLKKSLVEYVYNKCYFTNIEDNSKYGKYLRKLRDLLNDSALNYMLDAGTLIGSERLFSVIPHDYDFDFRINWREAIRVREVLKRMTLDRKNGVIFVDCSQVNAHWKLGIACTEDPEWAYNNATGRVAKPKGSYNGDSGRLDQESQVRRMLKSCDLEVDFFISRLLPTQRKVTMPEYPYEVSWDMLYPVKYRPFMKTIFPAPRDFEMYFKSMYFTSPQWCQGFHASQKDVDPRSDMFDPADENYNKLVEFFVNSNCNFIFLPCELMHNKIPFKIKFILPKEKQKFTALEFEVRVVPEVGKDSPNSVTYVVDQVFITYKFQ